jgi:hypothetical protein
MDNVQKQNNRINKPLSQTFRSLICTQWRKEILLPLPRIGLLFSCLAARNVEIIPAEPFRLDYKNISSRM